MGARGGIILGVFGAVFAAMTLALQLGWRGVSLGLPFAVSAAISAVAVVISRRPGPGIPRSDQARRVIVWSTIGEGVGLFVAANLAVNLGHPELLLQVTALVVGLHFLPMAYGIPFRPFYLVGAALLAAAVIGSAVSHALGGTITGLTAACALWVAALFAVRREMRAKLASGDACSLSSGRGRTRP